MLTVIKVDEEGLMLTYSDDVGKLVDFLTPEECITLIKEIQRSLFKWSKLTGKQIDWKNKPEEKKECAR